MPKNVVNLIISCGPRRTESNRVGPTDTSKWPAGAELVGQIKFDAQLKFNLLRAIN